MQNTKTDIDCEFIAKSMLKYNGEKRRVLVCFQNSFIILINNYYIIIIL